MLLGHSSRTVRVGGEISIGFLISCALLGTTQIASADFGEARIIQEASVQAAFYDSQLGGNDFIAVTSATGIGSGQLKSVTSHGTPDIKLFPTAPAFIQHSSSMGDSESSSNNNRYDMYRQNGIEFLTITSPSNNSFSRATSYLNIGHETTADSDTTVLKPIEIWRTTTGLIDPPKFKVGLKAIEGAFRLVAKKSGNASASCFIQLSFVGTIKNLNPSGPTENLQPIFLFSRAISADNQWRSDGIWDSYYLDLPFFTRVTGAHFMLSLGLRLQMVTHAEVGPVPEPGSWMALLVGFAGLVVWRQRFIFIPRHAS